MITVLCLDTCELICFKLGVMLDMTRLDSLIPVWMTLMFTQGHRIMGKLELWQSFCCKCLWRLDDVREMTEEVLCDEYEPFEHLLFLYYVFLNEMK